MQTPVSASVVTPPGTPTASVIIPTRARPGYLGVTLASIVPQARAAGGEVLVVCDGRDGASAQVAEQHGAHALTLPDSRGANAARNAGIAATRGELVVLVDDDVEAPAGWLQALVLAARDAADHDVFGGPIRARLEGGGPRACGREPAPITTLDFGPEDRDVALVWSANMAIRRSALARVGPFDETITGRGEEEDWQRRYARLGGRVRYIARGGLDHRRTPADARLRRLARGAYTQGRAARRHDERKGVAPALRQEIRTLVGCGWHALRRRCAFGIVFAAHTVGRLREAVVPR